MKTFPDTLLCGDVSDYHLAFPQYEHRMRWMKEGDEIDLGGRNLMAVESVIRDLRTTWWGYDIHASACCSRATASPTATITRTVTAALLPRRRPPSTCRTCRRRSRTWRCYWTKFADMNAYCDRLDHLIEQLGVKTIAPTHGLPITDVKATVPKVLAGLKAAALMPESGTNEKVPLTGAGLAHDSLTRNHGWFLSMTTGGVVGADHVSPNFLISDKFPSSASVNVPQLAELIISLKTARQGLGQSMPGEQIRVHA